MNFGIVCTEKMKDFRTKIEDFFAKSGTKKMESISYTDALTQKLNELINLKCNIAIR